MEEIQINTNEKLLDDKSIKGSVSEKNSIMKERENAAVFEVYDPIKNSYETKAFYKKKRKPKE